MTSKELLEILVEACDDKRADDIVTFDVKETSSVTDYYIICHAGSDRQVQAIADHVMEVSKEHGKDVLVEGMKEGKWVLVDVEDVIVHIFLKPERSYYNLERLFTSGEKLG